MSEYSSPAAMLEEETCSCSAISPYVERVTKSLSDRLISKFSDASEFDSECEQSELWSPLVNRTVFFSSPSGTGNIYSVDKMLKKLNNSHDTMLKKCINCLNGFLRCF